MADKARLFRIGDQPPLVQLIVSLLVVIVGGTLLFYLLIFAGSVLYDRSMDDIMSVPDTVSGIRDMFVIRYVQVSQQIALFLLPSVIIMYMIKKDNESFFGMDNLPKLLTILLVLIVALSAIPITTYTGVLNSKMILPERISGIENWMKTKEDEASHLTELLITSHGLLTLTVNIFVLAIIPAFSEEMFFRGVLQRMITGFIRSGHAGVIITAVIFSTIHFQFFGFIPRLILGLIFGYLFYLTRNLWTAIIAHFINNVIPVVISYYEGGNAISNQLISRAEETPRIPFVPIIIMFTVFYFLWLEYRKSKKITGTF
jgi:membrane protease YdiL (CAAX protease family)